MSKEMNPMKLTLPDNSRILVVLPHPDDECYSLSGTLSKHIAAGGQVTYACLTLGEMGRNMGTPPFTNRVNLPTIRREELKKSADAIGIQDLRMMGFHDKTIEFEDRQVLDGTIVKLLQELKPAAVFTFYPGYSVHPDHDATGAAVVRAFAQLPEAERPPLYTMAFSRNCTDEIGYPDVENDVSDFVQNKLDSIHAHRSQFPSPGELGKSKKMDRELRERFSRERFWTYHSFTQS
ncbi:bacillithiol biosynthesis deacetylase BshB2 [Paenibacillus campi]|uniref:bacillithiol biosynthesis deacetylase BshB2 n=1 Tax=Paenibacillus campi TaxID=3106031 RepID=UPI002AFE6DBF|nr:bacillithiol biosynthesis deacetylase BshB2 [Paenibacillus sp. SGZ-1009]